MTTKVRIHENLGERIFDVVKADDIRLDSMQRSMVEEVLKQGDVITCGHDVFEPIGVDLPDHSGDPVGEIAFHNAQDAEFHRLK